MDNSKVYFPVEKIKTKPNFIKNRNVKREAILINGRYLCPLCFMEDTKTITSDIVKVDLVKKIKYTARCNTCGIKIFYIKDIPKVD